MKLAAIKPSVIKGAHRTVLVLKKNSPQILTAVGIASGITSAVLASKATLKLEPIVDEVNEGLEIVRGNKAKADARTPGTENYTQQKHVQDLTFVYTRGGLKLVKLYGPAISVGFVSVGCIISAQTILQNRNAALVAAYTALDRGFNEYRKRVEKELGAEKEQELRYGITEERVDDTKNGVVEIVHHVNPNGLSPYAKFFDELNPNWQRDADYNLMFLKSTQNYANDKLQSRGHLFLNDVYDMLGIDRTREGAVVGWVVGCDGSDEFVDFGFMNGSRERVRAFVNGQEQAILLDFNVDGVIYDKI